MKIINILFCLFLIMLNGCNSNDNDTLKNNVKQQSKSRKKRDLDAKESQQEKITLTNQESKLFNSLTTVFKYTIDKLNNQIQGCTNGEKSKCTGFFDWLSKDIQKQKELANAFTTVYNFLKSKANDKDFDTYIKEAIDCKTDNQKDCNKDNKSRNGTNEIEQYFRGIASDIFSKKNNEEIYQCLKEKLLDTSDTSHYAGLTSNWKD
ncbi:Mlp family lipoprotein [Borreliella bavariensis]|uniref:Mlp family lipoprotein n=1 Tax=Borreliella bavariensis TaxID=664662 RepID=UPI001C026C6F|nr:Mlp family lipoprotein [Borreliella bavariensis]